MIDALDAEQLRRQQIAMRSFTESIEVDTLSMADETNDYDIERIRHSSSNSQSSIENNNQLRGFYDSNKQMNLSQVFDNKTCMKESSTIDTIIEVVSKN